MTEPALAESVKGYGRMYRHPVNDALYPSVTNVCDVLAKPWLAGWKAKMVAGHAWDNRFALMKIDREAAIDMLKGGPTRARNEAAAVGDLIHSYAEAIAGGTKPPEIPEELEPHAEPFLQFVDEYKPTFLVLEGSIFHGGPDDPLRYAGSFDVLCEIAGFVLLGDYKTGGEKIYDEVALQLGALREGDELWDEATGELSPMPKVDACIAIHLRPNRLGVHLIDAGHEAFDAFLGLRRAWPWDKDHTGAVGPRLNRVRLERELRRPDTLLAQLEQSVEETSAGADSKDRDERVSAGDVLDPAAPSAPAETSPADETEGDVSTSLVQAEASPAGEPA